MQKGKNPDSISFRFYMYNTQREISNPLISSKRLV